MVSAQEFMQKVVLEDLAASSPPVLRGRALHCLASFASAKRIPPTLEDVGLHHALLALEPEAALPVRMTASRAIGALAEAAVARSSHGGLVSDCASEGNVADFKLLAEHLPLVLRRIAELLADATEDGALITLEALHHVVSIPAGSSAAKTAVLPLVVDQLLCALSRCGGDIMIASQALDTIQLLVRQDGGAYVTLVAEVAIPMCVKVLSAPETVTPTQAENVMELISIIVCHPAISPSLPSSHPLVLEILPPLIKTMLTSVDDDLLLAACSSLRAFISQGADDLLAMRIEGSSLLDSCVQIVLRLFMFGSEPSASAACPIVILLFLR